MQPYIIRKLRDAVETFGRDECPVPTEKTPGPLALESQRCLHAKYSQANGAALLS